VLPGGLTAAASGAFSAPPTTSLAAPFHTNRDVRSRLFARIPGWARLWTALKTACLSATGTKGLTWPEEVSHKRETPCTGIGCTWSEGAPLLMRSHGGKIHLLRDLPGGGPRAVGGRGS
jgi:hypothetical protein